MLGALVLVVVAVGVYVLTRPPDPFVPLCAEKFAVCHGEAFEGAAQGPALVGRALTNCDQPTPYLRPHRQPELARLRRADDRPGATGSIRK